MNVKAIMKTSSDWKQKFKGGHYEKESIKHSSYGCHGSNPAGRMRKLLPTMQEAPQHQETQPQKAPQAQKLPQVLIKQ